MMSLFKFLDAYTLRARLFPAVLAVAPALAAVALLISWEKIALSNGLSGMGLLVVLFTMADFARKRGIILEPLIYQELGGKPSITMFRRADTTIDEHTKKLYRNFLAKKIGRPAPTDAEESADISAGDSFYEQAGIWLRANTRDTRKFPILWGELVSFGFRRNQLGLKWPSLALNALVVLICTSVLLKKEYFGFDGDWDTRIGAVLTVAFLHALYFLAVVDRDGVKVAARRYGRELILSTQILMPAVRSTSAQASTRQDIDAQGSNVAVRSPPMHSRARSSKQR